MALQQLTGVTFSSSYGPTFYRSVGLGDMAFIYAVSYGIDRSIDHVLIVSTGDQQCHLCRDSYHGDDLPRLFRTS